MERITSVFGFNYMATPGPPGGPNKVKPNEQIFLRRSGIMIPLGTFAEAKEQSGYATLRGVTNAFGIDGTNYGDVMSPPVNDNLFVDRFDPPVGETLVPSPVGTPDPPVGETPFNARGRKTKRANKRTHKKRANKKQRTNRRKGRK